MTFAAAQRDNDESVFKGVGNQVGQHAVELLSIVGRGRGTRNQVDDLDLPHPAEIGEIEPRILQGNSSLSSKDG